MERRFVSIWLPLLLTDWFSNKQPRLRTVPFVLRARVHGRMMITAANPLAIAQGIYPGMVLADAKAILSSLESYDHREGLGHQLVQRITEWCIRFTPCAASDPPHGIILDASGCTQLWGGDEAYVSDITKRLGERGYSARVAIGDTVGAAWAVARFGKGSLVVEPGEQRQAIMSLPPEALRLEEGVCQRLNKLGLRQVNNFIAIPKLSLRRRFGAQMLQRIGQALGEEQEFITPVYPPEPFQERLPCVEAIVTRTGIEVALERLLQTLCTRLRTDGKGLRTAVFRCYRTDSSVQGIEIGTSRPSHHEEHLFHLFSLKLSDIRPEPGIELFLLEATKTDDWKPVQESIWGDGCNPNGEALSELVDRLSGKLGADAIRRYLPAERWWPERSFKRAASLDEAPATEWRTDKPRPLRLLQPAESIEVAAPIPDYPPMHFRYKGTLHKVVKADGPERIEQEWWVRDGEHRDYYCVEDEEGRRYWIFRHGHYSEEHSPHWFLHGFFA